MPRLRRVVPAGGRLALRGQRSCMGGNPDRQEELATGRPDRRRQAGVRVYISLPKIEITETKCWAARLSIESSPSLANAGRRRSRSRRTTEP